MIRVTSGTAKGRKLKTPNITKFRAAQDVVKLAVFSILDTKVENAFCLDLYAGSGSFGIEALSRGAKFCHFVDELKTAQVTVLENLKTCDLVDQGEFFKQDAVKYVANASRIYDIIFADPFYEETSHKFLLQNMAEILNDRGVIVFSHGKDFDITKNLVNSSLELFTQRRFGEAYISILQNP